MYVQHKTHSEQKSYQAFGQLWYYSCKTVKTNLLYFFPLLLLFIIVFLYLVTLFCAGGCIWHRYTATGGHTPRPGWSSSQSVLRSALLSPEGSPCCVMCRWALQNRLSNLKKIIAFRIIFSYLHRNNKKRIAWKRLQCCLFISYTYWLSYTVMIATTGQELGKIIHANLWIFCYCLVVAEICVLNGVMSLFSLMGSFVNINLRWKSDSPLFISHSWNWAKVTAPVLNYLTIVDR